MLTVAQLLALIPIILVCATAVSVMLGIAWRRHHASTAIVSALGLNLAMLSLIAVAAVGTVSMPLLILDSLTLFTTVLILLSSLACVTLAHSYLEGFKGPKEEFYLLLLCATAGAIVVSASQHLATLFFGLELMSMPLYGMLAYSVRQQRALEAGIKYFVLSAAATAFMLFGMALLYAQSGSLEISKLAAGLSPGDNAWSLAGASLMLVGLGFKISLVPFHLWTADVYEGGSGPATTFLATISKLAVFIILLRLVMNAPAFAEAWFRDVLVVLALLSMLAGNLLALTQSNIKRLLGYSSIAHFGYLLVALVVAEGLAVETAGVYLLTYILTALGAFGVVTLLSSPYSGEDAASLHYYRGLFWRRPMLAAIFTVTLLSLAGIPFTAGFIGKFYIIALGVEASQWWLVGGVIVGSAIGLFYYLRVLVTLYLVEPGMRRRDATDDWGQRASGLVVLGLAVLIILVGIYPSPVINWLAFVAATSG
jgi:NADH-quinone oxidoreductase subunit N